LLDCLIALFYGLIVAYTVVIIIMEGRSIGDLKFEPLRYSLVGFVT
jgi:hypothetical protein